jgi:hypothetical protein
MTRTVLSVTALDLVVGAQACCAFLLFDANIGRSKSAPLRDSVPLESESE